MSQAVQPVLQSQVPPWTAGQCQQGGPWQQQQQPPPWATASGPWQQGLWQQQQQQPVNQQGPFASVPPPGTVPIQQWSNIPAGFPILVPGPGGSLVPAGSMQTDGGQQQQPPPQQQRHQVQDPDQGHQEAEDKEEEIPEEDLPAAPAPMVSKMTRVPTKRFVIGGSTTKASSSTCECKTASSCTTVPVCWLTIPAHNVKCMDL